MVLLAGWSPTGEQITCTAMKPMGAHPSWLWTVGKEGVLFTIQGAIDEPVLWHRGQIIVGRVLEDEAKGSYTQRSMP